MLDVATTKDICMHCFSDASEPILQMRRLRPHQWQMSRSSNSKAHILSILLTWDILFHKRENLFCSLRCSQHREECPAHTQYSKKNVFSSEWVQQGLRGITQTKALLYRWGAPETQRGGMTCPRSHLASAPLNLSCSPCLVHPLYFLP